MEFPLKDKIEKIILKTIKEYIELYNNPKREIFYPSKKLVFPSYRIETGRNWRLSEKEAHFIFSYNLEESDVEYLYYSVEVPTDYKYRFINNPFSNYIFNHPTGRSALIDFSIYHGDIIEPTKLCNIEFKYGNGKIASFAKDIYKLLLEGINGYLIIFLEKGNIDALFASKGEKGILIKLREIIIHYKEHFKNEFDLNIFITVMNEYKLYFLPVTKRDLDNIVRDLENKSEEKFEKYLRVIS
ncbi:hypothetical protein EHQ81_08485 [Leptospira selangorensis]|uniref:Endonuclease n=1 Tax=Leptospira selangorensis TaxID=2484982 RepID=A0A5F2BXV7_9LEPT|nr:hypothetical protein [Leptospira selangorensis]TGM14209.1 hypothetical protein EHQ81_08485 [Leptospira selangorensis]TGM16892.1 hypothetical protein EHQ82_16850 [Leptospira selangorensis]